MKVVAFLASVQLTNSGSLIIPGGTYTTGAGDVFAFIYTGSGNWKTVGYALASGLPLVAPSGTATPSAISGLLPSSVSGSNTTASMTISAGYATDSTATSNLHLSSPSSWAVSNGNAIRGYSGGTSLPASTTIHMFLCSGGSGTDTFASTSLTPACPTGYATYYRRIFSFITGSGVTGPLPFTADEVEGGAMSAYYSSIILDINGVSITNSSRQLEGLSVPGGVKVEWLGTFTYASGSASASLLVATSPSEPDSGAPATLSTGIFDTDTTSTAASWTPRTTRRLITNTSGQIYLRSSTAGLTVYGVTSGWIDFRR